MTLTKHRGFAKPVDEQLHVLPLCILDSTDEFGSAEAQLRKVRDGSVEVLRSFPVTMRMHRTPVLCKSKRIRLAIKARRATGIASQRGRGAKTALGVAAAGALRLAHETLLVAVSSPGTRWAGCIQGAR